MGSDSAIFLEDQDDPLDDAMKIESLTTKHDVRLHIHRCKHVSIKVAYSGKDVGYVCGPSKTIGTVKDRVAIELGIPKEDAAELTLQIAGTHEQPDVDVHLGTLITYPLCEIEFDLVPNPRIQGTA